MRRFTVIMQKNIYIYICTKGKSLSITQTSLHMVGYSVMTIRIETQYEMIYLGNQCSEAAVLVHIDLP